jgi:hypothetical protein
MLHNIVVYRIEYIAYADDVLMIIVPYFKY